MSFVLGDAVRKSRPQGGVRADPSLEVSRITALSCEGKLWKEPDSSTGGSKIQVRAQNSFRTASFVILRVTHARPLLYFDTGTCRAALGFVCDGATCTTGPAPPAQVAAGRNHEYEG